MNQFLLQAPDVPSFKSKEISTGSDSQKNGLFKSSFDKAVRSNGNDVRPDGDANQTKVGDKGGRSGRVDPFEQQQGAVQDSSEGADAKTGTVSSSGPPGDDISVRGDKKTVDKLTGSSAIREKDSKKLKSSKTVDDAGLGVAVLNGAVFQADLIVADMSATAGAVMMKTVSEDAGDNSKTGTSGTGLPGLSETAVSGRQGTAKVGQLMEDGADTGQNGAVAASGQVDTETAVATAPGKSQAVAGQSGLTDGVMEITTGKATDSKLNNKVPVENPAGNQAASSKGEPALVAGLKNSGAMLESSLSAIPVEKPVSSVNKKTVVNPKLKGLGIKGNESAAVTGGFVNGKTVTGNKPLGAVAEKGGGDRSGDLSGDTAFESLPNKANADPPIGAGIGTADRLHTGVGLSTGSNSGSAGVAATTEAGMSGAVGSGSGMADVSVSGSMAAPASTISKAVATAGGWQQVRDNLFNTVVDNVGRDMQLINAAVAANSVHKMKIRVNPPELGELFLEVGLDKNGVKINFRSETAEAARIITAGKSDLSMRLRDIGFTSFELSVDVGNGSGSHFGSNAGNGAGQQYAGGRGTHVSELNWQGGGATGEASSVESVDMPAYRAGVKGRVNITV